MECTVAGALRAANYNISWEVLVPNMWQEEPPPLGPSGTSLVSGIRVCDELGKTHPEMTIGKFPWQGISDRNPIIWIGLMYRDKAWERQAVGTEVHDFAQGSLMLEPRLPLFWAGLRDRGHRLLWLGVSGERGNGTIVLIKHSTWLSVARLHLPDR